MKRLLYIALIFMCLPAMATHFTCPLTGSPAHPVLTSMTGHSPGDTCLIPAGTYSAGFNFSNLNGIIILPQLGSGTTAPFWTNNGVFFTGQSYYLNNKRVTIRYITGTGISGDWITFDATHNEYATWSSIRGYDITGAMFRGNGTFPWTSGDTTTFQCYMWNLDSITETRCGMLFHCGFGDMTQNHPNPNNVSDSIVISRFVSTATTATAEEGTEIRCAGLFRGDFHDWVVTSTTQRGASGDVGLIYIKGGNCMAYRIYKNGGPGYIVRIYGLAEPSHPRDCYTWDCAKFNSTEYGLEDFRWDNTMLIAGATQSDGFQIWNCTLGNAGELIGYWSSLGVIGAVDPLQINRMRNNLGFNEKTNGKPFIGMNQSGGTWNNDTANNQYWATATLAKLDSVTAVVTNSLGSFAGYKPTAASTGAILHGGITNPFTTTDYLSQIMRTPPDLGYIQLPTASNTQVIVGLKKVRKMFITVSTGSSPDFNNDFNNDF